MLGELEFTVNVADRCLPDITMDLISREPTTLLQQLCTQCVSWQLTPKCGPQELEVGAT